MSVNNFKVSVIVPFYHQVFWLIEAVDSVFEQTHCNFEIIVINDGSKEDIKLFLDKYGKDIIYIEKDNEGPASARNIGIEISSGDYIAFLDSDDIWEKTKLEKQIAYMESNNAIWSHTQWTQFLDNDKSKISRIYSNLSNGYIFPLSLLSFRIATPSVMIRANYLKSRNNLRFNKEMRYGQDYYLWLLLSYNLPISLVPEVLCHTRLRNKGNAAKRVKVQLQVRSDIWSYLRKTNPKLFYQKKNMIFIILFYKSCKISFSFVKYLENKLNLTTNQSEFLSKVLYILPYIYSRILTLFFK